ncbi:MAG: DUF429 domain-containing protein [Gemmatimonadales bacterium]|nr:MAG: DUF429 domain-containing protein [Gemmatimonadales bacterium]
MPRVEEFFRHWPELELVAIDIPIGLPPCGTEGRTCDRLARRRLGPGRGSSVFPAPSRPALRARDHREASRLNRGCLGRGLSIQAWNLVPKIREVDRFLRSRPAMAARVLEVHPELAFHGLAGGRSMTHGKRTPEGREERLRVLEGVFPGVRDFLEEARERWPRSALAPDDLLDAAVCAVTARYPPETLVSLPDSPERDDEDLPMRIVMPPTGQETLQ